MSFEVKNISLILNFGLRMLNIYVKYYQVSAPPNPRGLGSAGQRMKLKSHFVRSAAQRGRRQAAAYHWFLAFLILGALSLLDFIAKQASKTHLIIHHHHLAIHRSHRG